MARPYHSALREEQAAQTRDRILQAMAALLAEGADDVSVAAVAERANVAVRTAYRYFPTRDALIDAFNQWGRERMGVFGGPESVDELPAFIQKIFAAYDKNADLVRAARGSRANSEIKSRRKAEQVKAFNKSLWPKTARLDPVEARQVAAVLHSLVSSDTYLNMIDHWGLDAQQAAEVVQYVSRLIVADLEQRGK